MTIQEAPKGAIVQRVYKSGMLGGIYKKSIHQNQPEDFIRCYPVFWHDTGWEECSCPASCIDSHLQVEVLEE